MAALSPARPARWSPAKQMRQFMGIATVSLFGLLVLLVFLLPLGYMGTTAFKNIQQIQDAASGLLPNTPASFNYQGAGYSIYHVPTDTGDRQWALVNKGREESDFVDPQNPAGGLIHWVGRWRTLQPVYHFAPTLSNFAEAWGTVQFPLLFRNTLVIA